MSDERKGTRVTFLDQTGFKSVEAVIADTVNVKRILPNIITKMSLPVMGPVLSTVALACPLPATKSSARAAPAPQTGAASSATASAAVVVCRVAHRGLAL